MREKWIHVGQRLIDRGAEFKSLRGNERYKSNVFHDAVESGNPELVDLFLGKHQDLAKSNIIGWGQSYPVAWVALRQADRLGSHKADSETYFSILDSLVKVGADLDANVRPDFHIDGKQPENTSFLAYFSAVGNDQAVNYLLRKGVVPTKSDVEFVRSAQSYCAETFGTDAPFSNSTPMFCRRAVERRRLLTTIKNKMTQGRSDKESTVHKDTH